MAVFQVKTNFLIITREFLFDFNFCGQRRANLFEMQVCVRGCRTAGSMRRETASMYLDGFAAKCTTNQDYESERSPPGVFGSMWVESKGAQGRKCHQHACMRIVKARQYAGYQTPAIQEQSLVTCRNYQLVKRIEESAINCDIEQSIKQDFPKIVNHCKNKLCMQCTHQCPQNYEADSSGSNRLAVDRCTDTLTNK